MCIVFISLEDKPRYKYVILSNRDEIFDRPTLQAHFWPASPSTIGVPPSKSFPSPSSSNCLQDPSANYASQDPKSVQILGGTKFRIISLVADQFGSYHLLTYANETFQRLFSELGRDAIRGGTWLGITKTGRFSVITNFQERLEQSETTSNVSRLRSPSLLPDVKSRGDLPTRFLCSSTSPEEYLREIREEKALYPGFSLIVGDCNGFSVYSNRDPENSIINLEMGTTIGLTNSLLNGGWFKEIRGVSLVKGVDTPDPDVVAELASKNDFSVTGAPPSEDLDQLLQPLLSILTDNTKPPANTSDIYQKTGESASIFVDRLSVSPQANDPHLYGTRCSIVILVDFENRITFYEKSLDVEADQWKTRVYHFKATPSQS